MSAHGSSESGSERCDFTWDHLGPRSDGSMLHRRDATRCYRDSGHKGRHLGPLGEQHPVHLQPNPSESGSVGVEQEDIKLALWKAYHWYLQSVDCAPKGEFFEKVERLCEWKGNYNRPSQAGGSTPRWTAEDVEAIAKRTKELEAEFPSPVSTPPAVEQAPEPGLHTQRDDLRQEVDAIFRDLKRDFGDALEDVVVLLNPHLPMRDEDEAPAVEQAEPKEHDEDL